MRHATRLALGLFLHLSVLGWGVQAGGLGEVRSPAAAAGGPGSAPAEAGSDFLRTRVGTEMLGLASGIGAKFAAHCARQRNPQRSPHLALILDSSTSTCRLLVDFEQHLEQLFKPGPKDMLVSVIAMRDKNMVVTAPTAQIRDLRRAIRQLIEESRNSQTRAKLKLNPAQRHQIQAWDSLLFITPDDCVKDWCGAVRFCLQEFGTPYALDAVAVVTLDNADTENDMEGLAGELGGRRIAFLAAAPDTLLTCSDSMPPARRYRFYESCKKELNLNYGEQFIFHRRESAVNEVVPVAGTNGPVECVGNPTGFGFYGLSRVGFVTNGAYFLLADPQKPQCACLFHGPGDRFTGRDAFGDPLKPGPLPGLKGGEKVCPPIKPFEFDAEVQKRCEPCLLSRDEVFQVYESSPYYQYLFSLWDPGWGNRAARAQGLEPGRAWSRGEGEYRYGAYHISLWDEKDRKPQEPPYEGLDPLRIHYSDYHPPAPWRYGSNFQGSVNGTYLSFYNAQGVEQAKKWLDGAIPALEGSLQDVQKRTPTVEPGRYCRRALAEIRFFLLCLENQLFYLRQYRNFLDGLGKDPEVAAVFQENANEAELKRRLEEAKKSQQAGQAGQGPSYVAVHMPRLLKQRCEEFAPTLEKRPPLYLGGAGRGGLDRFLAAKKTLCEQIGTSTWTNFYDLGWQRQYHWRKHTPTWGPGGGGGGGGAPPAHTTTPRPPRRASPSRPPTRARRRRGGPRIEAVRA